MKKIDGFFEKYWRFLHLIVCVYLAVNYFKLWERWRAYWVVHIIMAVFFFVYGRFWLLSAGFSIFPEAMHKADNGMINIPTVIEVRAVR